MTDALLDIKETSKKLRISPSFLYQLVDRKCISCYRIGKRCLFSPDQIEEYLAAHVVEAEVNL